MSSSADFYTCEYFNKTVRQVLGPYLGTHGFQLLDQPSGALRCIQNDVLLSLAYDSDRVAQISPVIAIGTPDRLVPIWFVIPESSQAHHHQLWVFRNEGELASVLERVRQDVLIPYAEPLWAATDQLRLWLDRFDRYTDDLQRRERDRWSRQ
jgi:hypothetical protein